MRPSRRARYGTYVRIDRSRSQRRSAVSSAARSAGCRPPVRSPFGGEVAIWLLGVGGGSEVAVAVPCPWLLATSGHRGRPSAGQKHSTAPTPTASAIERQKMAAPPTGTKDCKRRGTGAGQQQGRRVRRARQQTKSHERGCGRAPAARPTIHKPASATRWVEAARLAPAPEAAPPGLLPRCRTG